MFTQTYEISRSCFIEFLFCVVSYTVIGYGYTVIQHVIKLLHIVSLIKIEIILVFVLHDRSKHSWTVYVQNNMYILYKQYVCQ